MKVKIKAKLEISDHDGYCSGNECEYSYSIKEYIVDIEDISVNLNNLIKYLPIPEINNHGSYYCDSNKESDDNNLDKHSYNYTILEVVIIE